MIDHINYIKTFAEHLGAVDDEIAEKDLVIILTSSLPEEYNHTRFASLTRAFMG